MKLKDWSYLWNSPNGRYLLLTEDSLVNSTTVERCLIYDTFHCSVLVIENDELSNQVLEQMHEAGVCIVHRSEVQDQRSLLDITLVEMLESKVPRCEINTFLRQYQELVESDVSLDELVSFLKSHASGR